MPTTTTDFGLLAPCFWHRVCGGVVIAGETMCEGCRSEWGELIRPVRPVAATTVPVSTEAGTDGPVQTRSPEGDGRPRRNQFCWLCERRRTCRDIAGVWECAECATVT